MDDRKPDVPGGGEVSIGLVVGAGIGGCALVVGVIALVVYCYMKARRETNMKKTNHVFSTASSKFQFPLHQRSRVNPFPDPIASRKRHKKERKGRDRGHVNPGYARGSSDSSSTGSDVGERDLSPPRVRMAQYSSDSSNDDSSGVEDEVPGGSPVYRMERETDGPVRRSLRTKTINNAAGFANGRHRQTSGDNHRMSRRDSFERNPKSDSSLTINSLKRYENNLGGGSINRRSNSNSKLRTRERSSSSITHSSSDLTGASYISGETNLTDLTSVSRYQKNTRRSSPSSRRRYRKDPNRDKKGRKRPRRKHGSRDRNLRNNETRSRGTGSDVSFGSEDLNRNYIHVSTV
ncbi:uncharacterized protein LOC128216631 [Mya arenaria]|uniref:uncharacterized protein LOC128216631 n=1 Tax=Mya arenaria TaxID=6604 RepID=UPI0022E90AFB|nr:uncharacterized protein LOC128216631 [Mya arenaria]